MVPAAVPPLPVVPGSAPASFVRRVLGAEKYVERERIPTGEAPEGARMHTEGFAFEDGVPLEPRS